MNSIKILCQEHKQTHSVKENEQIRSTILKKLSKMSNSDDKVREVGDEKDEDMSLDDRVDWLRERGVLIETAEERKRKQVAKVLNQPDTTTFIENDNNDTSTIVKYVLVPSDTSKPLQEFSFQPTKNKVNTDNEFDLTSGDLLLEHLKTVFQSTSTTGSSSNTNVDIELLKKHTMATLACSSNLPDGTTVSDTTLRQVAADVHVETFTLVKGTQSNQYTGINMYLDEVGMLKRLPINTRASQYAYHSGYNPPPTFYGDIFLGRIIYRPIMKNISFTVGLDTSYTTATWLLNATNDNLAHQMEMNSITGQKDVKQPSVAGTDGVSKQENGYTWTQTEGELEVIVLVPTESISKDITVKFLLNKLQVLYKKESKIDIQLFERIDLDSCTWTLEKGNNTSASSASSTSDDNKQHNNDKRLIISMEKQESAFWPRIED